MTHTEERLKYCLSFRPDVRKKILTAEELTEYNLWMFRQFRKIAESKSYRQEFFAFPNISRSDTATKYLQSHAPLVTHAVNNSENMEILSEYDISVGRMLRYYPAHWHTNDSFEIYFALSGECPIYFENETVLVRPGTVLIVAPSVLHATPCYSDDSVLLYYLVRASTFQQVFWNQLPPDNLMSAFFREALSHRNAAAYLHFETGFDPEITGLLYRIYQEYCRPQRYAAQMLNALMSEFFVLLLRRYEGTARLPRTKDFYWKHEFSGILTFIQTHFATATQAEVAARFHYSDRQIGRIVQNCTGLTYAQLILKLRMEQAGKLLRQKAASIDTIAAAVGYSTPCSFYRAFSKYYGCTPRAFSGAAADPKFIDR